MRRPFIAGNWKMNGAASAASTLANEVARRVQPIDGVDVLICPPFTSLHSAGAAVAGTRVSLGAQDLFWRDSGAYTGRVSAPMLRELGCTFVIVGHSECRGRFGKTTDDITDETIRHFGDTDASVRLKLSAAINGGLNPILCVGETLSEREAGSTDQVVEIQIRAALHGLTAEQLACVTIAYEPVWAIGTGQTCDAFEAGRVCGVLRDVVRGILRPAGDEIRIQYGGSVTADNAREILSQPDIDGALVGGQSLIPDAFERIVRAAS